MASRHCDVCNEWHDLNAPWPSSCIGHYTKRDERNGKDPNIIQDLAPYKNVYGEVIGGRKQHRDFLRARGVIEVGNEMVTKRYEAPPDLSNDIRRAVQEHGGLRRRG